MAKVGHLVKEAMIKETASTIDGVQNLIVVSVSQLASLDSNELRSKLFKSDASLHIVKRRVGKKVLDSVGTEGLGALADNPNGSIGLIVAQQDAVGAAKQVVDYIKAHEGQMQVCGGLLEGRLASKDAVSAFAELPSREVLLSQVIWAVEATINDVCTTVERLISDVIWVTEKAAEKAPAGNAAPAAQSAPIEESAPAADEAAPAAEDAADKPDTQAEESN